MVLHRTILITSVVLILSALCITLISLFSPAWQVVSIPELFAEHQHGVWWDCVRAKPHNVISTTHLIYSESPLKCAHKFDERAKQVMNEMWMNGEAAAKEMTLHTLLPHHKAVIFFSIFVGIFGVIAVIVGFCSPCFAPNALLYIVAIFMAACCSIVADVLFFFGAMRIDTRFATGVVSVTQQRFGYALYLHACASGTLLIALFTSCLAAVLLIKNGSGRPACECCAGGDMETFHAKPYIRRPRIARGCQARNNCRPIVVLSEEDST